MVHLQDSNHLANATTALSLAVAGKQNNHQQAVMVDGGKDLSASLSNSNNTLGDNYVMKVG